MIIARARDALDARFRLHGRDPATGLDCVGLAAHAYGVPVPADYALRSDSRARIDAIVAAAGLIRVQDGRAGDLLLFRAGPGQLHLAIDSGGGIIHADAMLRKVVERPGAPPWPLLARWRKSGE